MALKALVTRSGGQGAWREAVAQAGAELAEPEAMETYPDEASQRLLAAAAQVLRKPPEALAEDLGASLPAHEGLRRLLRFGGASFQEFLLSLPDLPARASLAVECLRLPEIRLDRVDRRRMVLRLGPGFSGYDHAVAGLLRAIADDYGALALVDVCSSARGGSGVVVELLDESFSEGRAFRLARSLA